MKDDVNIKNPNFAVLEKIKLSLQKLFNSEEVQNIISPLSNMIAIFDQGATSGMLVPYILYLLEEHSRKRAQKHIPSFADKFIELSKKGILNLEFMRSELGYKIFEHTIKTIFEEINEEKTNAQKSFLLNVYVNHDPDIELISEFQRILSRLTPTEIRILQALYIEPEKLCQNILTRKEYDSNNEKNINLEDDLNSYVKANPQLYRKSIEQLEIEHLVEKKEKRPWINKNYTKNQIDDEIQMIHQQIRKTLTKFGADFIHYCTDNSQSN